MQPHLLPWNLGCLLHRQLPGLTPEPPAQNLGPGAFAGNLTVPQRTLVISRLDLRITCAACQHVGSPASFLLSSNQQAGERCLGIYCQKWPRHSCDTRMAKPTVHSFSFIGPCYAHSAWCQLTPPARSLPAPPASLHFSKAQLPRVPNIPQLLASRGCSAFPALLLSFCAMSGAVGHHPRCAHPSDALDLV